MGRWARSKQLAKASWALLRVDKELMVLPLISGLASMAIAASFLLPILVTSKTTDAAGKDTMQMSPLSYVLIFLMYVVLAYVTIFFKTALICGADERMRGGDPTIGSALSGAMKRAGAILPWAIVTATVSVILRSLEERAGLLGRIVIGIIGMAWAAVSFLVLPVLVFEGVGVGEAIKRSTAMLKRTWGENLILNGGIGLFSLLLVLPAIALVGLGFASNSVPVILVTVGIAVAWFIAVSCWSAAMTAIFQLALYRYATQTPLPGEFAHVDLGSAFRAKGSMGGTFGLGR